MIDVENQTRLVMMWLGVANAIAVYAIWGRAIPAAIVGVLVISWRDLVVIWARYKQPDRDITTGKDLLDEHDT